MNPTKEIIDDLETFKQQQIKLIYGNVALKTKKGEKVKVETKIVSNKL